MIILKDLSPLELAGLHVAMQTVLNPHIANPADKLDVLLREADRSLVFLVLHLLDQRDLRTLYTFMESLPVEMDEKPHGNSTIRFLEPESLPPAVQQAFKNLPEILPKIWEMREEMRRNGKRQGVSP